MAELTFKVDPKDLGKYEKKLAALMRKGQQRPLRDVGRECVSYLRRASGQIYYKSEFRDGWRAVAVFSHLRIYNKAFHSDFVEHGRAPGSRPPPTSAIRQWVLDHGMPESAVFPVARNIGIRGIKPRPVLLRPAVRDHLSRLVVARLGRYYEGVLAEAGGK